MVVYLLPAVQVQPRGDRAALQKSGNRSDAGEGSSSPPTAGQAVTPRGRRERKVDIPEADANYSWD